jgi:hypothetical protein
MRVSLLGGRLLPGNVVESAGRAEADIVEGMEDG